MKKVRNFFKLIFSRLFLVALLVILQVALIVFFAIYLTSSYLYFAILSSAIGLLILIWVINKKIHPEHKLMWAFLMLLFPFFGVTLYAVLSINKPTKKQSNKYFSFDKSLIKNNDQYYQKIYDISNEYQGQIKYLENTTKMFASKNNDCSFFPDGKSFYDSLINDIKQANDFIFMEYFIIRPGVMWNSILEILIEKVKQGVEVRLIYDDVGCARYLKGNYYKYLNSLGIKCVKFNKMLPFIVSYHNNRDHRKITVIDGKIAYTGGINFGDEYINLSNEFGYWKDNAIKIKGDAVDNFTVLFLQNFSIASKTIIDYSPYLKKCDNTIVNDEIAFPFGTGPRFYYENMAVDIFLNLINQAKKSIDISSPYLVMDHSLTNALINAKNRGVKVRVLVPNKPDKRFVYCFTKQSVIDLANHGIEVYLYTPGFNHAKSILIDDTIAYIGTTNLDFRSLLHHYECGTLLINCKCLKQIDENFIKDFEESNLIEKDEIKMNFFEKLFVSFFYIFKSLL